MRKLTAYIHEKSGIAIPDHKDALVSARVSRRMRALAIGSYESYLDFVQEEENAREVVELLDAISTNVTDFFREPTHFDVLSELARTRAAAGQTTFRMWSCACSTGEEPFSMVASCLEAMGSSTMRLKTLATDISTKALRCGAIGRYSAKKMAAVPAFLRQRYFSRCRDGEAEHWCVKPAVMAPVTFRRLNLSGTPFPVQRPFDVIFCRNVMIYFNQETRRRLIAELRRLLKPEGYLFIGHAESLMGIDSGLRRVATSVYTHADKLKQEADHAGVDAYL
ncbi:MAG: protein-glutamate O-methyltransferase CheR [Verrucomicrobiota bacterium]